MDSQQPVWEKIFANYTADGGLESKFTKNSWNLRVVKQATVSKQAKNINKYFQNDEIQRVKRLMRKFPGSQLSGKCK